MMRSTQLIAMDFSALFDSGCLTGVSSAGALGIAAMQTDPTPVVVKYMTSCAVEVVG